MTTEKQAKSVGEFQAEQRDAASATPSSPSEPPRSPPPEDYEPFDFGSQAEQINAAHHACVRHDKDALQFALTVGRLLKEVKDETVDHGEFLAWIDKNCEFSVRTAQTYMKLHRYFGGNPQHAAHLSMRQALALIHHSHGDEGPSLERPSLARAKRLRVVLEFISSEQQDQFWGLLDELHGQGDPLPVILQALRLLIVAQDMDTDEFRVYGLPPKLRRVKMNRYPLVLDFRSADDFEHVNDLLREFNAEIAPEEIVVEGLECLVAQHDQKMTAAQWNREERERRERGEGDAHTPGDASPPGA